MSEQEIHWHLDTAVWQRAAFRGYDAEIWWTGPGTQLSWQIHLLGENELDPVARGTGADETDAKAQAGYVLRKLTAAELTPAQLAALKQLADPARTLESTLFAFNGVRVTTAQALARLGLVRFREGSTMRDWGILLHTREQDEHTDADQETR
jgi:hypothetical protein